MKIHKTFLFVISTERGTSDEKSHNKASCISSYKIYFVFDSVRDDMDN